MMRHDCVSACFLLLTGVSVASAQCYTFSGGSAASLTVNITHLPPPTVSTTPWIYQYSSESGLVAAVSLKVGQTTFTHDPNSVPPLIDVSVANDPSSSFSEIDFNVAFSSANHIIAGGLASAYWSAANFPNGSLPATLPSLSGAHSPILIVNVIGPSGTLVDQTYTLTSASTCTTTTPPPVVVSGPTINSISPANPTASPGNQTVTVFGSQFQSGLTSRCSIPARQHDDAERRSNPKGCRQRHSK